MEASWHQNHIQKQLYVKTARKQKVRIFKIEFNDFSRFGDRFWEARSTKNRLKNGFQDDMHLGINCLKILVDSGGQVGAMRPPKRPKTPQLGAQDGPEAAQETPKIAQKPPKRCLNGLQEAAQRCVATRSRLRVGQEPSKGRPAPLQTSILDHFADYFGSFLMAFFPESPPKKDHDSKNARWRERGFAALKIELLKQIQTC